MRRRTAATTVLVLLLAASVAAGSPPALAAYPGANGPIVFERNGDLWRLDAGSTTPVNLTSSPDFEEAHPSVSPDGTRIAFEMPKRENWPTANSNPTVWVMGIDGSNPLEVTVPFNDDVISAENPTWSPDGTRLAFTVYDSRSFESMLYVANADGSGGGAITQGGFTPAEPAWSPVSNDILVTVGQDLWLIDAGSGQERVLFRAFENQLNWADRGDWRADGAEIVFSCDLIYVCVINADGSGLRALSNVDSPVAGDGAVFSPDGRQIAFEGQGQDTTQLYVMPAEGQVGGGEATPLTQGAAPVSYPSWGVAAGGTPPPDPAPDPDPQPDPDPGTPVVAEALDGDPATTERVDTADPVAAANAIADVRFQPRVPAGRAQTDDRPPARHVVLSRDDTFPDSLAGSALAGEGPLLFTNKTTLTPGTRTQIGRVLAPGGRIYLLGGPGAISAAIEQELRGAGYNVKRLSGASRVETALAVADEVKSLYESTQVLIARAYGAPGNETSGWADSVSGGGLAAWSGVPLIVTPSDALHDAVAQWLNAYNIGEFYLLGGRAALSDAVEAALPGSVRVSGAERTETAARIATELWGVNANNPRSFVVIHGDHPQGWAYGLAGAGLSSDASAPILMVNSQVTPATAALVSSCGAPEVDMGIIGDESVVPTALESELDALDGGAC